MRPFLAVVLLFSLAAHPACSEEVQIPISIEEVKAKHTDRLLEMPGVVSVGVGLDAEGRPAIVVGLDGPRPETAARLPGSIEGYPLVTRVIGPVKAQ